jgi:hypothetical protein
MDILIKKWQARVSWMRAIAEVAFFAGDHWKEHHFAICVRQWENAIEELKEAGCDPSGEKTKTF